MRIALYSHDTMGLGHIRRNINLAWNLHHLQLDLQMLLITGSAKAEQYKRPPCSKMLLLPSYAKNLDGTYLSTLSNFSLEELAKERAKLIFQALTEFDPDIFIVDNVARGHLRELDDSLEVLRQNSCFTILGLRDIRDSAVYVNAEWDRDNYKHTIERYYDRVWVYGDKRLFDVDYEYNLQWHLPLTYTGYLNTRQRDNLEVDERPEARSFGNFVLCMIGGGQDGHTLAETFLHSDLPYGYQGVLLTGAFMDKTTKDRLKTEAAGKENFHVLDFIADPSTLIKKARLIVSMGGYNSVIEILTHQKKSLVIPRIVPRLEQYIRAQRMNQLGLLDFVHPDDLNSTVISHWIHTHIEAQMIDTRCINVDGNSFIQSQIMHLADLIYSDSTYAEAHA